MKGAELQHVVAYAKLLRTFGSPKTIEDRESELIPAQNSQQRARRGEIKKGFRASKE